MAFALELVGERWVPLILRELMFGPRRFGELRRSLAGISANVLTQRLESLDTSGLVLRRRLPPPASVQVYELTPWGYESKAALAAVGRWAVRSPSQDPCLPLSAASLLMSFVAMLDAGRAQGFAARIGLVIDGESFAAHVGNGRFDAVRGDADDPDFTLIMAQARSIAAVVYARQPLTVAEATGAVEVQGDHALAARFVDLFPLPARVG